MPGAVHRRPHGLSAVRRAAPRTGQCACAGFRRARRHEYTCPMHPQIIRQRDRARVRSAEWPSSRMPAHPEEVSPELRDMWRRFRVTLALTIPLLLLSMRGALPGSARSKTAIARRPGRIARVAARDARLPVGRLAVLRARLGVRRRNRSLNMFTLIGLGVGVGVRLQRRRDARARHLPGVVPRRHGQVAGLLRGGRRDRDARAARPGAGAARAQPHRRRHPRAARPRAEDGPAVRDDGREEDVPLDDVHVGRPPARAAGREGAGRRRRARGRERASTSRWSPASRSRSRRAPATASSAARSTAPARFVMRAEQRRARHAAGADRPDGRRGAAQPRADPAARRRRRRATSCRRWSPSRS